MENPFNDDDNNHDDNDDDDNNNDDNNDDDEWEDGNNSKDNDDKGHITPEQIGDNETGNKEGTNLAKIVPSNTTGEQENDKAHQAQLDCTTRESEVEPQDDDGLGGGT